MRDGVVHMVPDDDLESHSRRLGVQLEERVAVLASGSNAAPARLAEKCGLRARIPVARVAVRDTAVVYSAHISRYGSIPATRIRHPGSMTMVHLPLLDPQQLAAVDMSEGSYDRVRLDDSFPSFLGDVWVYKSRRGVLLDNDAPIRVAEVTATCELNSMTQLEALELVALRTGLAPDGAHLSQGVACGAIEPEGVNRLLA